LLKDSLPSVPNVLQPVQVPRMLLYTINYKNSSSCIPVTFSLWKSYHHMMHLQHVQSLDFEAIS
jgi:hypothetical protein